MGEGRQKSIQDHPVQEGSVRADRSPAFIDKGKGIPCSYYGRLSEGIRNPADRRR
jgi:hypothetical protein